MAKKVAKPPAREGDQYMIRMPPGLRERISQRAAANGRSTSAEIVDAIEKHLEGADRITQIWDILKKYQQDIEDVGLIRRAVLILEGAISRGDHDFYGLLTMASEDKARAERVAKLPPITAEQAAHIRALIKETDAPEDKILKLLRASSIEEIKEYDRAVWILEARGRHPKDEPPA